MNEIKKSKKRTITKLNLQLKARSSWKNLQHQFLEVSWSVSQGVRKSVTEDQFIQ